MTTMNINEIAKIEKEGWSSSIRILSQGEEGIFWFKIMHL
jgi:hypothetical protein